MLLTSGKPKAYRYVLRQSRELTCHPVATHVGESIIHKNLMLVCAPVDNS
jgi:hypothetical protein